MDRKIGLGSCPADGAQGSEVSAQTGNSALLRQKVTDAGTHNALCPLRPLQVSRLVQSWLELHAPHTCSPVTQLPAALDISSDSPAADTPVHTQDHLYSLDTLSWSLLADHIHIKLHKIRKLRPPSSATWTDSLYHSSYQYQISPS